MAVTDQAAARRLLGARPAARLRRRQPVLRPSADPALQGQAPLGSSGRTWQWIIALLPVFPIVLLVLRLFLLSRQDLPTMLLLTQYVNPLGLASVLVITLAWMPPAVVLIGRLLGLLLLVSGPLGAGASQSWLAIRTARTPNWVVAVFVVFGALTWQLRYLPTLLMLTVAVTALTIRLRYAEHRALVQAASAWLPLGVAVLGYLWLAPGIAATFRDGDYATLALLTGPLALACLLTGPLPARFAVVATLWLASTTAFLAPFVAGWIFLQAPVLPPVALEVGQAESDTVRVIQSNVVAVDDRMTTLLDDRGTVEFVPNDEIRSKVLCPYPAQVPYSGTEVRAWGVEQNILEWLSASTSSVTEEDPRCQGRPQR